ncbi:MAG: hypothetical protein NW224_05910 [Leptolyngbyaceae cyanobacterium bins.302]|nr:hypothetical protein [Leptolyngbyaceae cyanobacterium bins.302]
MHLPLRYSSPSLETQDSPSEVSVKKRLLFWFRLLFSLVDALFGLLHTLLHLIGLLFYGIRLFNRFLLPLLGGVWLSTGVQSKANASKHHEYYEQRSSDHRILQVRHDVVSLPELSFYVRTPP